MKKQKNSIRPNWMIIVILFGMTIVLAGGFYWRQNSIKRSLTSEASPSSTIPSGITEVRIEDIVSNPSLYEGKTVIIKGTYGFWNGEMPDCSTDKVAIESRSDRPVFDKTGCLYIAMTNAAAGVTVLSPSNFDLLDDTRFGEEIKVKGVVRLIKGKPILGK